LDGGRKRLEWWWWWLVEDSEGGHGGPELRQAEEIHGDPGHISVIMNHQFIINTLSLVP
jgi:hypothetical protein